MYLSSLQVGLQSAHVTADLSIKYDHNSKEFLSYKDWAKNHKTMIFLNGGNQENLIMIQNFLTHDQNTHPWAYFREDEASLNNALTCVGVVLPARVYETKIKDSTGNIIPYTEFQDTISQYEWELLLLLNSLQLAR